MRAAVAMVVLAACEKSPPKPRPAPDAKPPAGQAVIDDQQVQLVSAKAFADNRRGVDGLTFRFSTQAETCASIRTTTAPALQVFVPPGPGDGYFVGQAIHVDANTPARDADVVPGAGPENTTVTLARLGPTTADVQLDVQSGQAWQIHGQFEVEVCDPPPRAGLALDAPTDPAVPSFVHGGLEDHQPLLSVIARVERGAVKWLDLYRLADMTCEHAFETLLRLDAYVPLSPVPGTAQPARIGIPSDDDNGADDWYLPGWIRLDAATATDVTFSVVVRRDTGKTWSGHLEGVLHAKVCPMR